VYFGKFVFESIDFEDEKRLSQSWVDGKRKRAGCRLRKGGGQGKWKRSECWEG